MIEIRHAVHDEVHVLARVGLAAWCKGIQPLVPSATSDKIEKDNPFVPFLEDMGARVLVAVIDDRAAGIVACEHSDDYISDVWVAPEFEGRGVASALIGALEREISGRGFSKARIHVAAANTRALGLYEHLGYVEVSRETAFDPILEISLDKIGLEKHLSAQR
ncbi:acetyltransferase [Aminobacter sp. DSM 101952]|uniref:GNAT family N-acetyltransferase n=1 Tax=Aminobacter sp. DSM 101952 TaxID=2735891 RepID=UPI0006F62D31|nr:GNAT family N-acetyltransferase [Aminobacter sp. DSM 101952]KQU64792.1 acetyltransferase [Aminobacter sp. DSM 101952]